MSPLETAIIILSSLITAYVIFTPFLKLYSKTIINYLKENPGSPFIFLFIILLLTAAFYFSSGMTYLSNELSEIAYFMILSGVILQATSEYIYRFFNFVYKRFIFNPKENISIMSKCPRCGYENPPEAKYCLNCGYKLIKTERTRFETEGLLLVSGGLIMLIELIFNTLLRITIILALIYFIFGLSSIYAGEKLYRGSYNFKDIIIAYISIALGFIGTVFLYVFGLILKGLISPDWIIFLIVAYKIYIDRKKLMQSVKASAP